MHPWPIRKPSEHATLGTDSPTHPPDQRPSPGHLGPANADRWSDP